MKLRVILAGVALIAGTAACSAAVAQSPCTTSAPNGSCGPYSAGIFPGGNGSQAVIQQDVFDSRLTQTLTADSAQNWNVTSTAPAGNTAVLGYPNAQTTYTICAGSPCQSEAEPLSDFGDFKSSFANNDPAGSGFDYEWAYDIWLAKAGPVGGNPWASPQEVMIWTDNHGQTPAGNNTGNFYTAMDGSRYEVWVNTGSNSLSSNAQTVTFLSQTPVQSGTVDLSGFFEYLVSAGYDASDIGVDQVDFGYEVCSTNGSPATFSVSNYNLVANASTVTTPPVGLSQTAHEYVNFGWTANGGTSYEFELETVSGTIVDDTTVTHANVQQVPVVKDTAYQWRVRDTGGQWTQFRAFTSP